MAIDGLSFAASKSPSHAETCSASGGEMPGFEISNESDDSVDFDDGYEWEPYPQATSLLREMRNHDLHTASTRGFRVGYIEDTKGEMIVSVSCQISKLDISNDALQAWGVERSENLVLLIRYPRSYQTLQQIFQTREISLSGIEMRVGLCEHHFTSPQIARDLFKGGQMPRSGNDLLTSDPDRQPGLRDLFISYSLHHVLNKRFISIAKLRSDFNLSWTGAELFCYEMQGKTIDDAGPEEKHWAQDGWSTPVPYLMECDHFADAGGKVEELSLPLLAMQYTLRHFVRCPEFCLVCHCKTGDGFESLKPYVCSRPLCLFQYLELGLGASIECEVRSKPMVVDLLVSLAYASAASGQLDTFPDGLRLKVPLKNRYAFDQTGKMQSIDFTSRALLDPVNMVLSGSNLENLHSEDWIMICDAEPANPTVTWHCQVTRVPLKNEVVLSYPVKITNQVTSLSPTTTQGSVLPPSNITKHHIKFSRYHHDFEELSHQDKRSSIKLLLDTLPRIDIIANLLSESSTRGLRSCLKGRVSPAAFDLLRWIIASNRSYIVHETEKSAHIHEQMSKHLRFRFIQGAPDREHRFLKAVQTHADNIEPSTICAWHGSPLHNWHGILREGLHFRKITHGRSSGDGVYLSPNFSESLSFSQRGAGGKNWPQSVLDIQYVISLNEIINCPDNFVCRAPHYVVQFIDWIQPRYLLVKIPTSNPKSPRKGKRPTSNPQTGMTDLTKTDNNNNEQSPTKAKIETAGEVLREISSNPAVALSPDYLLSERVDTKQAEEGIVTDRVSKKARKYSSGQLDLIWNSLDAEDGGSLLL
jgi:ubiquitin-conjugating enzyme E2 Q